MSHSKDENLGTFAQLMKAIVEEKVLSLFCNNDTAFYLSAELERHGAAATKLPVYRSEKVPRMLVAGYGPRNKMVGLFRVPIPPEGV